MSVSEFVGLSLLESTGLDAAQARPKLPETGGAMAKAIWQGEVIAESDDFKLVEGNVYFPPSAIQEKFFEPSSHQSVCPWKGTASYYHVVVDGKRNENAAWFYPQTKEAAAQIKDHVAFWKGVTVER